MDNDKKPISVRICMGGACSRAGSRVLFDELKQKFEAISADGSQGGNLGVSIEGLRCVGMCCHGPVAIVGEQLVEQATAEDIEIILKSR